MKTTATFDRRSQTIELHTPVEEAAKQWVVNGGPEADYAVVFARLLVGDQDEGVHPLLCKLREGNGNTRRGVTLQDTGWLPENLCLPFLCLLC
jgi:acyl-CoA oxidase